METFTEEGYTVIEIRERRSFMKGLGKVMSFIGHAVMITVGVALNILQFIVIGLLLKMAISSLAKLFKGNGD